MESTNIKRDTTVDLFNETLRLVKENGHYDKAASIMDYVSPDEYKSIEITNYRFDFQALVNWGSSEGIYIDCYLWGEYTESENNKPEKRYHVATLKTLNDDINSFKIMGELCGALTFYAHIYVNKNIDRYTPLKEI